MLLTFLESSQIKLVLVLVFMTWEFLFSLFLLMMFDELHRFLNYDAWYFVSKINILVFARNDDKPCLYKDCILAKKPHSQPSHPTISFHLISYLYDLLGSDSIHRKDKLQSLTY